MVPFVIGSKQRLEGMPMVLGKMIATALVQGGACPRMFNRLLVDYIMGVPVNEMQPSLDDLPRNGSAIYGSLKSVGEPRIILWRKLFSYIIVQSSHTADMQHYADCLHAVCVQVRVIVTTVTITTLVLYILVE